VRVKYNACQNAWTQRSEINHFHPPRGGWTTAKLIRPTMSFSRMKFYFFIKLIMRLSESTVENQRRNIRHESMTSFLMHNQSSNDKQDTQRNCGKHMRDRWHVKVFENVFNINHTILGNEIRFGKHAISISYFHLTKKRAIRVNRQHATC
jgi:hypothetical protein